MFTRVGLCVCVELNCMLVYELHFSVTVCKLLLGMGCGKDNKGYETIMGQQGLGCVKENGELFADFCLSNDLMIAGTIFPHRRKHKATFQS